MRFFRDITIGFSSGALAGLLQAMIFWLIAHFDLAQIIHVSFSAPEHWAEIYPSFINQFLLGGVLGLFIAIPLWHDAWIKRGLILGLIPALFVLLYFYPYVQHEGMFGLDHGNFAFAIILALGWFYGLFTSGWAHWME